MSQPIVMVESTTEETGAVAAAATEAVAEAFRTGVQAGESVVRSEQFDAVSRAEFDAVLRRLDEVEATAGVAVAVAEVALEESASDAPGGDGDDSAAPDSSDAIDAPEGEPRPPERRAASEPGASDSSSTSDTSNKTAKGYGHPGWYGKR